jgi:hypothetical protein
MKILNSEAIASVVVHDKERVSVGWYRPRRKNWLGQYKEECWSYSERIARDIYRTYHNSPEELQRKYIMEGIGASAVFYKYPEVEVELCNGKSFSKKFKTYEEAENYAHDITCSINKIVME